MTEARKLQIMSFERAKYLNRKIVHWNKIDRAGSCYNPNKGIWEIKLQEHLNLHCNGILVKIAQVLANELAVKTISLEGVVYHF